MIIGITGLIGSGKSAIGNILKNSFGLNTIDCDDIVNHLYRQDLYVVNNIENFAGKCRKLDNTFDKNKLLKHLMKNREHIKLLNDIVHPMVKVHISDKIIDAKINNEHLVILIPLLFESKMEDLFDSTVYIYTDRSIRLDRLKEKRRLTIKQIDFFDSLQIPAEEKFLLCDHVYLNNSDKIYCRELILNILKEKT